MSVGDFLSENLFLNLKMLGWEKEQKEGFRGKSSFLGSFLALMARQELYVDKWKTYPILIAYLLHAKEYYLPVFGVE